MERILCEKPKTFYNVVSGEKIADGVAAYVGFANGWYSCVFADGRSGLYDSSGRLAAEDFDAAEAAGNAYLLRKGKVSSLFAADGKRLMHTEGEIKLYSNGWVETFIGGIKALYRPDMSLAASGYFAAAVLTDGAYYLTQEKDGGDLVLFNRAGTKLAEGIISYQFYAADYYVLTFADKTAIYDTAAGTVYECTYGLLELKPGKMFTVLAGEHAELYRVDGKLVQAGYDRYEVFANGMYAAALFDKAGVLFYPDGRKAAENVCAYGEEPACGYVTAMCGERWMLFNAEAELLHESEHPIFVYPNGWYFCGDGERFSGMLCRGDNGVVQMWLAEARAFANGWYVTATPDHTGKDTVVSLYDGDDVLVAQSIYGMDFDEEHLCYVLQGKDGKCSMHDDGGKELISGADDIFLLGSLFAVQKGDVLSLYAFGSPEGGKMPRELWTGTIQQFGDGIMFCGVEDDGLLEIV